MSESQPTERRQGWMEAFRRLGEAFFDVLRAELAVVTTQTKGSLRWLAIAAALFALATTLLVLILPTLVMYATVAALAPRMGWSLAALTVAGIALVLGLVLVLAGRFLLVRYFENPVTAAGQRVGDHLQWLNQRVLGPQLPAAAAPTTEGDGDGPGEAEQGDPQSPR